MLNTGARRIANRTAFGSHKLLFFGMPNLSHFMVYDFAHIHGCSYTPVYDSEEPTEFQHVNRMIVDTILGSQESCILC